MTIDKNKQKIDYIYDGDNIIAEYQCMSEELRIKNSELRQNFSTEESLSSQFCILSAFYIHGNGIDSPLAMLRGNQAFYYHQDALSSVREITNDIGNVIQRYEYDSFGKITLQEGLIVNPYSFTGRQYDMDSGLYYYRARYYDPETGRFIQEDPLFDKNLYSYVGNDPVNKADPYGKVHWATPISDKLWM